ncbi:MAG: EamA family transporter [Candidatus Woesearchaeota archaeon]|nr:MAG: EamA family transporter [Candidatus Woesearchaeota archaeon]
MEWWIIFAFASAVFVAVRDVLAKKIFINHNTSPRQLVFEHYLLLIIICLVFLVPFVSFSSLFSLWHLYLFKAMGAGGAAITYFKLLEKYEISMVSPLINLSPLILIFLSSLFLSEGITSLQVVGIVVLLIATYALEITEHHKNVKLPHEHHVISLKSKEMKFFIYVLVMLFLFSFGALADKMLFQAGINVSTNLFFTAVIIFVVVVSWYLYDRRLFEAFRHVVNEPETLVIASMAVISDIFILLAIAIPSSLVGLIIPLRRTSTFFSSFFGGMLFHEKHLARKLTSVAFMIVGILFIVW